MSSASGPDRGGIPGRVRTFIGAVGRVDVAKGLLGFAALGALIVFMLMIAGGGERSLVGLSQADKRIGSVDAPVVITEYVDLMCEACARHNRDVTSVLLEEARAGRVIIERMPIAHAAVESRGLAYASFAAAEQNRMWDFTREWFAQMNADDARADAPGVMRVARDAGLDMERFARDFAATSERSNDLRGATAVARQDGVAITPTLVITGMGGVRHLSGIQDPDVVRTEIDAVIDAPDEE